MKSTVRRVLGSLVWLSASAGFFSLPSGLKAETPPASAPTTSDPKDHTLFMGADILVQYNNGLHRLRDVKNVSFIIAVDGKPVRLPMYGKTPVGLEVHNQLKITATSASVDDLKTERAYTPERDPNGIFQNQVDASYGLAAANDMNGYLASQAEHNNAVISGDFHYSIGDRINAQVKEINADNRLAASTAQVESGLGNVGLADSQRQVALAEGMYDAVKIDFSVASEQPLDHPFVVIVMRFREKDAKANLERNWILAKALDAIGPRSQNIHILQGGFPPGYEIIGSQFHLYNDGNEIATNVSDEKVSLTADEAFQYSVSEYIGNHKNGTLGAVRGVARIPSDLAARLLGRQHETVFVVKVSPLGRVLGVYSDDSAQTKIADEDLVRAVGYVYFFPALQKGKPVVGTVKVKLTDLVHS